VVQGGHERHDREAATHVRSEAGPEGGEIRILMNAEREQEKLEGRDKKGRGLQGRLFENEAVCIILDPFGLL